MVRLFTEYQWRAAAEVEFISEGRYVYDCFHATCGRKRVLGGAFQRGEFYLGTDGSKEPEFRVFERWSGLDFAISQDKTEALAEAREQIVLIDWYLPAFLERWKKLNANDVSRWEQMRSDMEAQRAIADARANARAAKKQYVGKRRREIFAAADGKCHYCKTELVLTGDWEVDHKMPKVLGGSNERVNLVAACMPCNRSKKDKTDVEFFALLAQRGN